MATVTIKGIEQGDIFSKINHKIEENSEEKGRKVPSLYMHRKQT